MKRFGSRIIVLSAGIVASAACAPLRVSQSRVTQSVGHTYSSVDAVPPYVHRPFIFYPPLKNFDPYTAVLDIRDGKQPNNYKNSLRAATLAANAAAVFSRFFSSHDNSDDSFAQKFIKALLLSAQTFARQQVGSDLSFLKETDIAAAILPQYNDIKGVYSTKGYALRGLISSNEQAGTHGMKDDTAILNMVKDYIKVSQPHQSSNSSLESHAYFVSASLRLRPLEGRIALEVQALVGLKQQSFPLGIVDGDVHVNEIQINALQNSGESTIAFLEASIFLSDTRYKSLSVEDALKDSKVAISFGSLSSYDPVADRFVPGRWSHARNFGVPAILGSSGGINFKLYIDRFELDMARLEIGDINAYISPVLLGRTFFPISTEALSHFGIGDVDKLIADGINAAINREKNMKKITDTLLSTILSQ